MPKAKASEADASVRAAIRAKRKETTRGVQTLAAVAVGAAIVVAFVAQALQTRLRNACSEQGFFEIASFGKFPTERRPWHAANSWSDFTYACLCDSGWRLWDRPGHKAPVQLSAEPLLYLFDDFLSPSEVDAVLKKVRDLEFAASGLKDSVDTGYRTSHTASVDTEAVQADALLRQLTRRMHATAHVPLDHGELLQVVEYREHGKYELHLDADPDVPRVATMLVYLSDVEGGGETVWPYLAMNGSLLDGPLPLPTDPAGHKESMLPYCNHASYLKVAPKKGRAVLMYNLKQEVSAVWNSVRQTVVSNTSLHGACPVQGTKSKWLLQKWMQHKPISV